MATENPIRVSGSNESWSNPRPVPVPSRSESSPPSMESPQGGSGYNNLKYAVIDNHVDRFRSKDNSQIYLSQGTLSTHMEVSEDGSSQKQTVNSVSDMKNGFDIRLSPGSQDDSSSSPTPQHSRSNSSNGEMNTVDERANFLEMSDDEKSLDESTIITKMKSTNISGSFTVKYPREPRYVRPERQLHQQQSNVTLVQGGAKMGFHGQFHYGQPYKLPGDGQTVLQSSGFTPPLPQLYAAAQTAYMMTQQAHIYNMQSPTVYSPQYGYGPYTNMIPQFGYPSHGPSAGSVVFEGEMQYAEKLYVQLGQPSYPDPMSMQYFQQSFLQNHKNAHESQSHKSHSNMGLNYYGVQQNMGIMVQYMPTQHVPPLSPGSVRYADAYNTGWQPQECSEGASGPRFCNFLEELKFGKGRRFSLSDVTGHIVELSVDQHGSRFIQQKLERCNPEEKEAVFREVLPHACKLMTDVFGNYVIQKFFEYGNSVQRKELAEQLMGQIVPLSLQMYACRVIQKALDVIEPDQRVRLARELDGQVMRCVRDQNGNHVIQKCIEIIPSDRIEFMLSAFNGQVSSLSMHPYGCRVIQRLLERFSSEHQCRFITEEILESVCVLSKDQYGNYVTQHVLETGTSEESERIVRKLSGNIVQLSLHKFASNVIEKCLEYGGRIERDLIVKEIAGHDESYDSLLMMMKDKYGNYVVQKIFEKCTVDQRATLLSRVRLHSSALKKYTYGKHIVTRLEQPFSEESKDLR